MRILTRKKNQIIKLFSSLSKINCSIVFFISPKKINKIIEILKKYFFERKILICREISKYYEEIIRSEINDLGKLDINIKGEITLVISEKKKDNKFSHLLSESDKRNISKLINKLSIKEIIKLINKEKKISKKLIYDYCLKLKNEN